MMKQSRIIAALVICLMCAMVSCSSDDDDSTSKSTTVTVKVSPSADNDGVLEGEGLTFKITSFTDNTAGVCGTAKIVDKSSYNG